MNIKANNWSLFMTIGSFEIHNHYYYTLKVICPFINQPNIVVTIFVLFLCVFLSVLFWFSPSEGFYLLFSFDLEDQFEKPHQGSCSFVRFLIFQRNYL